MLIEGEVIERITEPSGSLFQILTKKKKRPFFPLCVIDRCVLNSCFYLFLLFLSVFRIWMLGNDHQLTLVHHESLSVWFGHDVSSKHKLIFKRW